MKKLISVFAALALVGSLAAQKKKPAAPAAPAKPVVAAPAMPAAATTAMAMAPAAKGAAKGMGLFVEGRGGYTFSNGSSSSYLNGDTATATAQPYALSNAAGIAAGGSIGYNFLQNLGIVASFDYRNVKSREWSATGTTSGPVSLAGIGLATAGAVTASTSSTLKSQNTKNTMILGLGVRPSVDLGPGSLYAGAGLAMVLPYDSTTAVTYSNSAATGTNVKDATVENKSGYGLAFGAYGELGYQFNITDNIYIGLGARIVVITSKSTDKDSVTTYKGTTGAGNSFDVTVTSTGKETVDPTNTDVTTVSGTTTTVTRKNQTAFASDGTTDITGVVSVGFKF